MPIECTAPKLNPNVNYGLCLPMMCRCRNTDCNKCTTLTWDDDTEEVGCVWGQWVYGNSLYSQLFCEPKVFLKNEITSLVV